MTRETIEGYVTIKASKGRKLMDTRDMRTYRSVIVKEKYARYFVEI